MDLVEKALASNARANGLREEAEREKKAKQRLMMAAALERFMDISLRKLEITPDRSTYRYRISEFIGHSYVLAKVDGLIFKAQIIGELEDDVTGTESGAYNFYWVASNDCLPVDNLRELGHHIDYEKSKGRPVGPTQLEKMDEE